MRPLVRRVLKLDTTNTRVTRKLYKGRVCNNLFDSVRVRVLVFVCSDSRYDYDDCIESTFVCPCGTAILASYVVDVVLQLVCVTTDRIHPNDDGRGDYRMRWWLMYLYLCIHV